VPLTLISFLILIPPLLYGYLQWRAARGWLDGLKGYQPHAKAKADARISVIIAARNEAKGLPDLLHALLNRQIQVPDEILVVDDNSDDETVELLAARPDPRVRLLPSGGQGKRAALEIGFQAARGHILLFTDGDCLPEPGWVAAMSEPLADGRSRWVSGPVLVDAGSNVLSCYDALESHGMLVVIAAGFVSGAPILAQGASIGLRREDLAALRGFQGLPDRASGDDVFLLRRFVRAFPGRCHFVPDRNAIVRTRAPERWVDLIHQRLRWTSKAGLMPSFSARIPMVLVFMASVEMLLLLAGLPWWPRGLLPAVMASLCLKIGADTLVLWTGCRFSGRAELLKMLPMALIVHPLLVMLSGLAGPLRSGYVWKGRRVH
jgi:poly-beta-1,6-N-acetyl-D-glucosamine synthase